MGFAASGLPGPSGNRETFVWIAEAGREGALEELETAARAADA
jgi:23S rRNA (cytidine1920-2'-O)/16S rRNA (cytidine1409-2'-O)-methyltransferase